MRVTFSPVIPSSIIGVMIITAAVWNGFIGLSLSPGWYAVFAPAAMAFLAGGWIRFRRSDRRFSETAWYLGLWCIWPPVCVWLAYLSITVGYPMQDNALAALDAALGFHWIEVSRFVEAIPWLEAVLNFFYVSPLWQFAVSVALLARLAPRGRNCELLTQMLIAMSISLVIGTFIPAIGPAAAYGYGPPPEAIIHALQSGSRETLPYAGIVSFPSFHTVMALLFTYAHRDVPRTFCYVLPLNAGMLAATLYIGDHYLSDMLGGFLVAGGTIVLTAAAAAVQGRGAGRAGIVPGAAEASSAAV